MTTPALTPDEFRDKLEEIGLTQAATARVLDINPRTVRRYIRGDLAVTALVAWALRGLQAAVDAQEAT